MGGSLHAQRRMHQGVRLRRQSALPAGHGARLPWRRAENELPERRRQGVTRFRDLSARCDHAVATAARREVLERLGQKSASAATPAETPDFVFYTGCNVLKTPHIALLALDIMDVLGVTLSGDGRAEPLLRHPCSYAPATSKCRPHGHEHDREAVALEVRSGDLLVPELLRPVHRNHAADRRTATRLEAVRDDAVHALPREPARIS